MPPQNQSHDVPTRLTKPATNPVCIGLGSNLGDRESNLHAAIENLSSIMSCDAVSDIFETEPVGAVEQGWFLNMALKGTTELDAPALLKALQQIETSMGRCRCIEKGPRIIDLDILLYSSTILRTENLVVPHPELQKRAFVLMPLAQVAADWMHPKLGATIQELLEKLKDDKAVRIWTQKK